MSPGGDRAASPGQQLVISGVGGQGVIFVARLLADAAITNGDRVLTSETHGMAQRGGVVVSHLKVGDFESPLVRVSRADGLIVLRMENLDLHRPFLAPGGWIVVNDPDPPGPEGGQGLHALDADGLAVSAGNPRAANLVLLGFALSRLRGRAEGGRLFCSPDAVREALERRLSGREDLLADSRRAFDLGLRHGRL